MYRNVQTWAFAVHCVQRGMCVGWAVGTCELCIHACTDHKPVWGVWGSGPQNLILDVAHNLPWEVEIFEEVQCRPF